MKNCAHKKYPPTWYKIKTLSQVEIKAMQESDWKIFKKVKEAALDKCCEKSLAEFQQLISDNSKSNHQRFLDLFDRVDNANSEIARMFDGHSRSRAAMQALAMRKHGLIPHESMTKFSQEFQEQTNPEKYG